MSGVSASKEYFLVFCKFFIEEVETIFWESEAKHAKPFKSKFGHRKVLTKWFWSYLMLRNKCCDHLKRAVFSFFANCWVTKLKPFSGEVKQNVEDCLNQKLGIGSFLENDFERILGTKTSFVSVWKGHFLVFWRFLSDEVETIFWEIKRKRSKLFQSKFGHKKLLRKCLWSYVQLKNECCECLKRAFSVFFANFSLKKLKPLFGKVRQSIQSHLNQSLVIGMFLENGFEAILSSKTSVVIVWKEHFSVFCKLFSDKVETIFWESEAKHSRLLKLKCGCRSFLENGFEATWSWNTNVLSLWKEHLSVFCKFFEWRSWNHLLEKLCKAFKAV